MPEGPPKTPPEKAERKESAERQPRYRTIEDEVLKVHEDGSKTHRVLECNGVLHRRCVDVISYDEKGEPIFADQLSREELGPCDGKHA